MFIVWQMGAVIQVGFVVNELVQQGQSFEDAMLQSSEISVLMGTLESNLNFFLLLLGFVFGFVAIWLTVRYFHNLKFKVFLTTRDKLDWKRIYFGAFIIGITIIGSSILDYFLSPTDYLLNFQLDKFIILAIIGLIMVPIQTTFEELLFRGYFMQGHRNNV